MSVKVLLVEDHDSNREVLARRLTRRGFDVVSAPDGMQAINRFQAEKPDLVLMDISLPTMSGIEAFEMIRQMDGGRAVPIVALTAHAMDSMRQKCEAVGFTAFLTKPLEFERLVSCIQSLTANQP